MSWLKLEQRQRTRPGPVSGRRWQVYVTENEKTTIGEQIMQVLHMEPEVIWYYKEDKGIVSVSKDISCWTICNELGVQIVFFTRVAKKRKERGQTNATN